MNYKIKVNRNDGTELNLQADNFETAKAIASKYHNIYGYDVAVVECRTVYMRRSYQGSDEE